MKIQRTRWVMTKNTNGKIEIFCGLARNYDFKDINNLGNTAVKTYLSRNKAISSFESSYCDYDDNIYKAVEILETFESTGE